MSDYGKIYEGSTMNIGKTKRIGISEPLQNPMPTKITKEAPARRESEKPVAVPSRN